MKRKKILHILNYELPAASGGGKKTLSQRAGGWLLVFFAAMIALTFLSRAADAVTVAKVRVETPSRKALSYQFYGEGVIEAQGEKVVSCIADVQIEDVFVSEGQSVAQGDALFALSIDELQEKLSEARSTLRKLQIALEQEQLSAESQTAPDLTLERAREDLEDAKADLAEAEQEYQKKLARLEQTILEEKEEALALAEQALSDAQYTYETDLKAAQRKVQDLTKALERLENKNNQDKVQAAMDAYNQAYESGDEDRIDAAWNKLNQILYGDGGIEDHRQSVDDAEDALSRAAADLKAFTEKGRSGLAQKEKDLEKAKQELEDVKNGTYDATDDLAAIETPLEQARDAVKTKERALRDAERNREAALKTEAQTEQKSALTRESLALDIAAQQKKVDELAGMVQAQGLVTAPIDGVITALKAVIGERTSAQSMALVSSNAAGYGFRATLSKDQGDYLEVGMAMTMTLKGKKNGIRLQISGIEYSLDDDTVAVTADLPEGAFVPGMSANYDITRASDLFDTCVPLQAIREDSSGEYVLVMQERNTILGTESIAVRVAVTVLDKDNKTAAVSGALNMDDQVIISSNKAIGEGDRVRVK